MLEERSEALVEPSFVPVAARHEVSEPLVGEFVGDEIIGRDVERCALVEKDVFVQGRGGRVFHSTEDEIAHDDLRITVPGKIDPRAFAEVFDHPRRMRKRADRVLFASLGDDVHQRHVAALDLGHVTDDVKLPGDERYEVTRMGNG